MCSGAAGQHRSAGNCGREFTVPYWPMDAFLGPGGRVLRALEHCPLRGRAGRRLVTAVIPALLVLGSCWPAPLARAASAEAHNAASGGPVIKAPAILNRPDQYRIDACYPRETKRRRKEGDVRIIVAIEPDGSVSGIELPPETAPWVHEAATCIVALYVFAPGLRDGLPVRARATLPMTFRQRTSSSGPAKIARPTVSSDDEEIIDIYRQCYPAELEGQAQVGFRISVTEWGRVQEAVIIASSGDQRLDQAGLCIIRALRFSPARRDGLPVRSTLGWQILVGPLAVREAASID